MHRKMQHIVAALMVVLPSTSLAFDAADVVEAAILPGWRTEDGRHMAGLRLRLEPGWKTYWRSPGDGGIPPRFDWTGSTNVQSVAVHWPVPTAFSQNGLTSIGYEGEVLVPLEIDISVSGAAVLGGTVEIGVCEEICVPVSFDLRADLAPGGASQGVEAIKVALADRPMTAGEAGVSGATCVSEPISDGMRVTVTMDVPRLAAAETTVIEFADPTVWVSQAKMTRDGDRLTAVAELVPPAAEPFAIARDDLRFTVLGDGRAVDIRGCTGG